MDGSFYLLIWALLLTFIFVLVAMGSGAIEGDYIMATYMGVDENQHDLYTYTHLQIFDDNTFTWSRDNEVITGNWERNKDMLHLTYTLGDKLIDTSVPKTSDYIYFEGGYYCKSQSTAEKKAKELKCGEPHISSEALKGGIS